MLKIFNCKDVLTSLDMLGFDMRKNSTTIMNAIIKKFNLVNRGEFDFHINNLNSILKKLDQIEVHQKVSNMNKV